MMRCRAGLIACLVLTVVGLATVASLVDITGLPRAAAASPNPEKRPAPPPLTVDKDAPLLLLERPAPQKAPTDSPVADNSACHCCHANYKEESFAVAHAHANIGCVKCHGESLAHRNDENNITPPEIMYPPEAIEKNCQECHDTHDAPAAKVIARWQERCAAKSDPKGLLCMDCHGEHRLALRSVHWDKKTGKLIDRDKAKPSVAPQPTRTPAS